MTDIHWARALAYGFFAELVIFAVAIPLGSLAGDAAAVYSVPVASFTAMLIFGVWIGRRVERRVLHGALVGVMGILLYLIVPPILSLFLPATPPVNPRSPTPNDLALAHVVAWLWPVSHGLKILGGALGGFVADRGTRPYMVEADH
jgi:hypothetical protein